MAVWYCIQYCALFEFSTFIIHLDKMRTCVSLFFSRLPELQYTQLVNVNCTNLTYAILSSPNKTEEIKLKVEKYNIPRNMVIDEALGYFHVNRTYTRLQFSEFNIHVEVQQCPLGFVFNNSSQACICHPKLQQHEINCNISTQTVYRRSPLWESLCALWIFSASFGVTEFLPDGDRTPTHIETIKMLVWKQRGINFLDTLVGLSPKLYDKYLIWAYSVSLPFLNTT